MNPTNEELIIAFKSKKKWTDDWCYLFGQLQGRLDVLEKWFNWANKIDYMCSCHNCNWCFLNEEISKIKEVLK